MTTLKSSDCAGSQPRRSTSSKCPVEETGRNSVIPSIKPSNAAAIQSGIGWLDGKFDRMTSRKAPEGTEGRNEKQGNLTWAARHRPFPSEERRRLKKWKRRLSPLAEHRSERALGIFVPLADLQLSQDGMPADINLVPLAFHVAERAVVHFAEVTQRRSIADEGMHFFLGRRTDFDGCENQFE